MGVKREVEELAGNSKMLEFEQLPRSLQKLLRVWIEPENWQLNLLQACQKADVNYKTVRSQIARVGSRDFYALRARLIREALDRVYPQIVKALVEKAIKEKNTRAMELILKMRGELIEKVDVSGGLNLNIIQDRLLEAKKRLDNLGEDNGKGASG